MALSWIGSTMSFGTTVRLFISVLGYLPIIISSELVFFFDSIKPN